MIFRVGSGHDSHRLVWGRPLIMGGIHIDFDWGLDGHSDADVVLHAITDALLGASALGDIGDLFPDQDPANKDRDSREFLEAARQRLLQAGWQIGNLDVTIFAQEPKLGPIKQEMQRHIAFLLQIDPGAISIKAKTGERVGHIGRGEAIGCHATVLIHKA